MAKQNGDVFDRHSGQQQFDGERIAEAMRMRVLDVC
jgi:hypothetical protein